MKFKQKYSIRKALSLVGLMMLVNACYKEPYDVIIDWDWRESKGYAPPRSVIQEQIEQKDVRNIFINLVSPNSTAYSPGGFHMARDTLQDRLNLSPNKIKGMGTIYVNSANGAQLPDPTDWDNCGMALEDSLWFTANGWKVQRLHPQYTK